MEREATIGLMLLDEQLEDPFATDERWARIAEPRFSPSVATNSVFTSDRWSTAAGS